MSGLISEVCKACGVQFSEETCEPNECLIRQVCEKFDPAGADETGDQSVSDLQEAIRRWDEFAEPLRQEFGIPVWRPEANKKRYK